VLVLGEEVKGCHEWRVQFQIVANETVHRDFVLLMCQMQFRRVGALENRRDPERACGEGAAIAHDTGALRQEPTRVTIGRSRCACTFGLRGTGTVPPERVSISACNDLPIGPLRGAQRNATVCGA
jgi:hypothetical protein